VNDWIEESYVLLYDSLKKRVTDLFERSDKDLYTLHDHTHCENVEKMIKIILSKKQVIKFNKIERFILSCSAWIHDIGMCKNVAWDYFNDMKIKPTNFDKQRRVEHHHISCWYLLKNYKDLFFLNNSNEKTYKHEGQQFQNIVRTIAIVVRYHRKKEDINECKIKREIKGETIRLRLLAAILRLADSLHIDASRVDYSLYSLLQMTAYTQATRLHWLTAFFVSNVFLDIDAQAISVNLDLPDYKNFLEYKYPKLDEGHPKEIEDEGHPKEIEDEGHPKEIEDEGHPKEIEDEGHPKEIKREISNWEKVKREISNWNDSITNLEYIISSDIYSELTVLNKIFSANRMPIYVNVKINTSVVSGFDQGKIKEIEGVLSELEIIFSPNTSKVITTTLDSIKKHTKKEYTGSDHFLNELIQLVRKIQKLHQDRPGHVTLGKIYNCLSDLSQVCQTTLNIDDNIKPKLNVLEGFVKYIKERKDAAEYKLFNIDMFNKIVSSETKRVFLFGYSSSIIKLLETQRDYIYSPAPGKELIDFYILEGATKRRYTHNNQIEYNDGIKYAREIRKIANNNNIYIIPDIGFGSLLSKSHGCPKPEKDGQKSPDSESNQTTEKEDVQKSSNSKKESPLTSLVLFGTNGIDHEGNCAVSSGHLSIAIIAKSFKVPVKVVSDSLKFGEWKCLKEARDNLWLTSQKIYQDELKKNNIRLINYREEKLPKDLINELHTEICCLKRDDEDVFNAGIKLLEIEKAEFNKELNGIIGITNRDAQPII